MKEEIAASERSITSDVVFGHVMSKPENCLRLLQLVVPELNIQKVHDVHKQHVIDEGLKEKSVRLDIYAQDDQGRLFDIEMQVVRQQDIGKRIRYYQAQMDKDSLSRGKPYYDLNDSYIIFLCPYDPFYHGRSRYEFSMREDHYHDIKLETGSHLIFLNSKGKDRNQNKGLQQFFDFMNGIINESDTFIAHLNSDIAAYVGSDQWRLDKMKLTTELQDSERKGERKATIKAIKKLIMYMRKSGNANNAIFKQVHQDYHEDVSDEEIRKLMAQAK